MNSKTIYGVFAIAVFVVSLAQPAFAAGCGQNAGRYSSTTTSTAVSPRVTPPPAQGAGIAR